MSLLTDVSELAVKISKEILLPIFLKAQGEKSVKSDGSWLTTADTQAHEALILELPKLVDYPVLSEEMTEQEQQQILDSKSASYWCIDPLDGTSNFTQGIPYWCTSIALIIKGKMELAVIVDPNRGECFAATSNRQTTLNGVVLAQQQQTKSLKSCMGLIDFKRLHNNTAVALITDHPYRSQRSFGASALDLCWIAADRCQLYLHGKQKLWDHAAGLLILQQAGGQAETFYEIEVFQNNLQPKSVIAASNVELMKLWKDYFHAI